MHFDEPGVSALKSFAYRKLASICRYRDDSMAVANILMPVLQREKSVVELKDDCKATLEPFLSDDTISFVEALFDAIESNSYLGCSPSPQPNIGLKRQAGVGDMDVDDEEVDEASRRPQKQACYDRIHDRGRNERQTKVVVEKEEAYMQGRKMFAGHYEGNAQHRPKRRHYRRKNRAHACSPNLQRSDTMSDQNITRVTLIHPAGRSSGGRRSSYYRDANREHNAERGAQLGSTSETAKNPYLNSRRQKEARYAPFQSLQDSFVNGLGLTVENIPDELNAIEQLSGYFKQFGELTDIHVDRRARTAHIGFLTIVAAITALHSRAAVLGDPGITKRWFCVPLTTLPVSVSTSDPSFSNFLPSSRCLNNTLTYGSHQGKAATLSTERGNYHEAKKGRFQRAMLDIRRQKQDLMQRQDQELQQILGKISACKILTQQEKDGILSRFKSTNDQKATMDRTRAWDYKGMGISASKHKQLDQGSEPVVTSIKHDGRTDLAETVHASSEGAVCRGPDVEDIEMQVVLEQQDSTMTLHTTEPGPDATTIVQLNANLLEQFEPKDDSTSDRGLRHIAAIEGGSAIGRGHSGEKGG
ncbi:hypothetical protein EDD11_001428 [Mortierella claussenii]|nr:hypothetical protein EDD11_001428 [Mortierella claussenii]